MKKRLGLTPLRADKLTMYLASDDVLGGLNIALRARKAILILDYSTKFVQLKIMTPKDEKASVMLEHNTRTKVTYPVHIADEHHLTIVNDLLNRMNAKGVYFAIGSRGIPNSQKREGIFQLRHEDSVQIGLTLLRVPKGSKIHDSEFSV